MRTRSQVNTYRALEAQHRRDAAAFAAAIAASRAEAVPPADAPRADASNAPSRASSSPVEAAQSAADAAFITPEKKTRKRKLCASNASNTTTSATASTPAAAAAPSSLPPPAEISPAARDAKRRIVAPATTTRNSPTPSTTPSKVAAIRRTLDYADADEQQQPRPRSAREVLERVAAGGRATDTNADADAASGLYVGRAEERLEIERVFAAGALGDPTRALFVIGPPGTGKSSCVAHVAARHGARTAVVRVNCSTFATPAALLDAVRAQFVEHGVTPRARALPALDDAQQLDAFLAEALHAPSDCVLVLDEVDHLVRLPSAALQRGAQRLLAFFVRWAHLPYAGLRFVGILNGVDMHAQIAAFLAHDPNPTRVVLFPAYALDELVAILAAVVRAAAGSSEASDAVEPRALELIARKVAARDGDARRAVGLLRQCARACLAAASASPEAETPAGASSSSPLKLRVRDVLKCASAAIASQLSVAKQIQQLPRAPKVLLFGVTRLAACRETASATLQDVVDELAMLRDTQASLAWLPRFRLEELQQHLGALECYALVKQTPVKSKSAWQTKLASSVPMDALARAFRDDELLAQLPTSATTE